MPFPPTFIKTRLRRLSLTFSNETSTCFRKRRKRNRIQLHVSKLKTLIYRGPFF